MDFFTDKVHSFPIAHHPCRSPVQVQDIVVVPEHLEQWQARLIEWAASNLSYHTNKELKYVRYNPLMPINPSLLHKYMVLGVVNDAVIDEEEDYTGIVIDPWPSSVGNDKEHNDRFVQGAAYSAKKLIQVKKFSSRDAKRLPGFLDDVWDDLGIVATTEAHADDVTSTASAFFKKAFKGHTKYRALCGDKLGLVTALKLLNQVFSPHNLYGRNPSGEEYREDE